MASQLISISKRGKTIAGIFLISGISALMYQIVWQRRILTLFGCNIESVTVIVSVFMAGLGFGALIGGAASRRFSPIRFFIAAELLIGLFGLASVPLINRIDNAFVAVAILLIPTILMGTTLPVLVSHLAALYQDIGKSISQLYMMNTVGAALACFLTADILFSFVGLQTTASLAATLNGIAALLAYIATRSDQ